MYLSRMYSDMQGLQSALGGLHQAVLQVPDLCWEIYRFRWSFSFGMRTSTRDSLQFTDPNASSSPRLTKEGETGTHIRSVGKGTKGPTFEGGCLPELENWTEMLNVRSFKPQERPELSAHYLDSDEYETEYYRGSRINYQKPKSSKWPHRPRTE